jgi:hypothetical protein
MKVEIKGKVYSVADYRVKNEGTRQNPEMYLTSIVLENGTRYKMPHHDVKIVTE